VYTGGAQSIDELGNISSGSGIWYSLNDERKNSQLKLRTNINSDQPGELTAILWAVSEEPPQNNLTIISKSAYIDRILGEVNKWERTGYIGVRNKELLKAIIAAIGNRGGPTCLQRLAKDNTEAVHQEAKSLAILGASKELYDEPNLEIHPNFNLTGGTTGHDTVTSIQRYL
jgi:hypothetical protein